MAAKKKTKVIKKAAKTSKPMKKAPTRTAAKGKTSAKSKVMAKPSNAMKPKATTQAKTTVKSTAKATFNWDDTISPLDDRLIVEPEVAPTMTAGGLYIPVTVSERPVRGKVLAKGPGRRNKKGQLRPLDVSVGDDVMYPEWSGTKIEVEGHEVLILREEDILGIAT